MIRRERGLVWLAAWVVLAAVASTAQAERYGDVEIVGASVTPGDPEYGYAEHVFIVENLSEEATRRVTLQAGGFGGGDGHRISRLSRTVEVGPGARSRVTILQPPVELGMGRFTVVIDGEAQREAVTSGVGGRVGSRPSSPWSSSSSSSSSSRLAVLASRQAMSVGDVTESLRGRGEFAFRRQEMPLSQWSRRWLGYSTFAAVVVTADEWDGAPPEVRDTLLDYVRAGGVLCLLGEASLPDADTAERAFTGGRMAELGFGTVMQVDEAELSFDLRRSPWIELVNQSAETDRALDERQGIRDANRRFPVMEDIAVPIRSLFVLLLVFAVLAGPVNLVVLTRKRRRIWLLWTTPLIALVFCGSVFGYSILAHGVTPTVRLATVTVLDQEAHRATTLGWLGYYAPLAPGELVFDDRTELTPQLTYDGWSETGRSRAVTWVGNEQRLGGGWVAPGVPSHFRVRRVATDRRRLQVEVNEVGLPVLVNHLEADIDRIHFMDGAGRVYKAEDVAAGTQTVAERVSGEGTIGGDGARGLLNRSWEQAPGWNESNHMELLQERGYVAVLRASPFVDPALPRYETRPQQSLLIGRLGSGDIASSLSGTEGER